MFKTDNVFDLDRQVAALRALDADVIGLQEVDVRWGDRSEWRDLAAELGRMAADARLLRADLQPGPGGSR